MVRSFYCCKSTVKSDGVSFKPYKKLLDVCSHFSELNEPPELRRDSTGNA